MSIHFINNAFIMKQKTYLILALALLMSTGLAFQSLAQGCSDLFFSEYVEGTSFEKYIEIYNPTSGTVDLSDYQLRLYANGSATPSQTMTLSGTLASGAVIVVRNNSATGFTGGVVNSNVINHNGDDAFDLYKISAGAAVDIFGRIGDDPGTAWTATGLSTLDRTLRRKSTVTAGVTVNPSGTGASAFTTLATEWDGYLVNDVSGLGSHTSTCISTACSISSIMLSNVSGCNNNGTPLVSGDDYFTADVVVSYTGAPATDSLVLTGSAPRRAVFVGSIGTSSYTFTGVQFAANGLPISLTAFFKADGACTLTNLSAGIAPASCSTPAPCTLPFFSEYIEGSGNNKCLEIYNPTASPIDLAAGGYTIKMYFNGSGSAGLTINLTGIIPAGGTYVVCNSSSTAEFTALANQIGSGGWFNGDDAVSLENSSGVLDIIGQIGTDPGSAWTSAGVSTVDQTLRRYNYISKGDNNGTDAFDPSLEWASYPINTSAGLGYHISTCPTSVPAGWATGNPGCAAGSTSVASGTWTQTSNCYNAAPGADDLTYAFQEMCGDATIIAQYVGVTPFGFAGLMMRESLNPGSKYVWMFMRANTNASWSIRSITGLTPTFDTKPHLNRTWMKLTRSGSLFRGYLSTNGTTWQLVFQSSVSLNSCVLVGLATHSNVDGSNVTATFRNVSVSSGANLMALPGAAQAVDMVSEAPAMQTSVIQSNNSDNRDAFGIWPNPAGNTLEVNIPVWNTTESVQLQVNDMQGRPLMYRQIGDQQQRATLDLSSLAPGVYLLTLRSGEHLEIARFVKQ